MRGARKCSVLAGLIAWLVATAAAAGDTGPAWFRRPAHPLDNFLMQSQDEWLVVLQRRRDDGAELLTLRYPFAQSGTVVAYAGAGLNRAVYLAEPGAGGAEPGVHVRHRSIGAAAELGAQWRLSRQLAMAANLHWIDLPADAGLLRNGDLLAPADPIGIEVALGWHFR